MVRTPFLRKEFNLWIKLRQTWYSNSQRCSAGVNKLNGTLCYYLLFCCLLLLFVMLLLCLSASVFCYVVIIQSSSFTLIVVCMLNLEILFQYLISGWLSLPLKLPFLCLSLKMKYKLYLKHLVGVFSSGVQTEKAA